MKDARALLTGWFSRLSGTDAAERPAEVQRRHHLRGREPGGGLWAREGGLRLRMARQGITEDSQCVLKREGGMVYVMVHEKEAIPDRPDGRAVAADSAAAAVPEVRHPQGRTPRRRHPRGARRHLPPPAWRAGLADAP